jgi:peptidyl-prolyl cis-trans isomerase SurA
MGPPSPRWNRRSPARALAAAALLGVTLTAPPASAEGGIVERIVAVVGYEPILLSELRERARPFLLQVRERVPAGPQQAAAESQVYRELVFKMIDEQLIAREAARQKVSVRPSEIETALQQVAANAGLPVPELFRHAAEMGLDEAAYRREIERQILEGKLLMPWAREHATLTEADLRERYDRAVKEKALPPALTTFELARSHVQTLLAGERMEAMRKKWLDGLRQGTYVEVSL